MADDVDGEPAELTAFRARIEAAGLHAYADRLLEQARPSVRLEPASRGETVAVGGTKLGGLADLPADAEWPFFRGEPLDFVAQVNLAETHSSGSGLLLPQDGLLSFFYDATTQAVWGFDPQDAGGSAIRYSPGGAALVHRDRPARSDAEVTAFPEIHLTPRTQWTLTPWESYDAELLGMSREDSFKYAELADSEREGEEQIHRLLGHPDPVQGDMQLECQLVTNGLNCGDSTGYLDPRAETLRSGAVDWRLLMQIDSDPDGAMMWGDLGRLYFWMTDQSLTRRDWTSAWAILQCG